MKYKIETSLKLMVFKIDFEEIRNGISSLFWKILDGQGYSFITKVISLKSYEGSCG